MSELWDDLNEGGALIDAQIDALEDARDSVCDVCKEPLEDGGCTNPFCDNWRFGAEFDEAFPDTKKETP